jgi:hypothetical protein
VDVLAQWPGDITLQILHAESHEPGDRLAVHAWGDVWPLGTLHRSWSWYVCLLWNHWHDLTLTNRHQDIATPAERGALGGYVTSDDIEQWLALTQRLRRDPFQLVKYGLSTAPLEAMCAQVERSKRVRRQLLPADSRALDRRGEVGQRVNEHLWSLEQLRQAANDSGLVRLTQEALIDDVLSRSPETEIGRGALRQRIARTVKRVQHRQRAPALFTLSLLEVKDAGPLNPDGSLRFSLDDIGAAVKASSRRLGAHR